MRILTGNAVSMKVLVLLLFFACNRCAGTGGNETDASETTSSEYCSITLDSPKIDPSTTEYWSGEKTLKFKVSGEFKDVQVAISLIPKDGKTYTLKSEKSGNTYTVTFDTSKYTDGSVMISGTCSLKNGFTESASIFPVFDNNLPVVEIVYPGAEQTIIDHIVLRMKISDGAGTGIKTFTTIVNGEKYDPCSYEHTSGPVFKKIDTTNLPEEEACIIPSSFIKSMDLLIEVNATDFIHSLCNPEEAECTDTSKVHVNFSPPPEFLTGKRLDLKDIGIDENIKINFIEKLTVGCKGNEKSGLGIATDKGFLFLTEPSPEQYHIEQILPIMELPVLSGYFGSETGESDECLDIVSFEKLEGGFYFAVLHLGVAGDEIVFAGGIGKNTGLQKINNSKAEDLNLDMIQDIVIASPDTGKELTWLFSDSEKGFGFSNPCHLTGLEEPVWIDTGDFDNNDEIDIVVAWGTNHITTFLRQPTVPDQKDMCVGYPFDAGHDNEIEGKVLQIKSSFITGEDDKLDLIVLKDDGTIEIMKNTESNGNFAPGDYFCKMGDFPSGMVVEDFNKDDMPDFAVLDLSRKLVSVRLWTGDENYGKCIPVPWCNASDNSMTNLTYARLSADETYYLVMLNQNKRYLYLMKWIQPENESPTGRFQCTPEIIIPGSPLDIAMGSLTGGEDSDIVILSDKGFSDLGKYKKYSFVYTDMDKNSILSNNAAIFTFMDNNGSLPDLDFLGYSPILISEIASIRLENLDNDLEKNASPPEPECLDLVIGSAKKDLVNNTMELRKGTCDGSFTIPKLGEEAFPGFNAGPSPADFVLSNIVTNTGSSLPSEVPEIVAINVPSDINEKGEVRVFKRAADSLSYKFELKPVKDSTGKSPVSIDVGYLNSDTYLDVVTANSGSKNVSVLFGNGTGTSFTMPGTEIPVGGAPITVKIREMDTETDETRICNDIVVLLEDRILFLFGTYDDIAGECSKNAQFNSDFLLLEEKNPSSMILEDMNGDTKPDIIYVDGTAEMLIIYLNLGTRQFSKPYKFIAGKKPYRIASGDFNRDMKPDLAVANKDGKSVSIFINSLKTE